MELKEHLRMHRGAATHSHIAMAKVARVSRAASALRFVSFRDAHSPCSFRPFLLVPLWLHIPLD